MKKYVVLVFTVFFISCQGEKKEKTIESVKVWYYNKIFERIVPVGCEEIVYLPEKLDTIEVILEDGSYFPKPGVILESIITDKEILQEIAIELNKRKVIKEDYMDARIKCYILFNNGQTDSLCIYDGSIYGNYNTQPVKLTNKFLYLIRNNCGFYRWIGASYMRYFDELNDPSFVREKVKSRSGEEY